MFIKEEVKKIISFLRHPHEFKFRNASLKDKFKLFAAALLLKFLADAIFISMMLLLDEFLVPLDHTGFDSLIDEHFVIIILIVAILVPITEEFIFRFPLRYKNNYLFRFVDLFTKKGAKLLWKRHYIFFFYAFAIAFGLIHTTNYNNNSLLFYLLSPVIVGSQIFAGLLFGYVRIRLGYWWGVLMHGVFNGLLFLLPLMGGNQHNIIHIQNEGKIDELKVTELLYRFKEEDIKSRYSFINIIAKEDSLMYIDTLTVDWVDAQNISLKKFIENVVNLSLDTSTDSINVNPKTLARTKFRYELKDDDVLINFKLTTNKPIDIHDLMKIIGEEYKIEKISNVLTEKQLE